MKVIAIVVTYNGMKWYQRCFDSLRDSIVPIETIVIDNRSGDNTVQYIKENYPDIHLVESETNLGFGKANNVGMKYAIEQDADFVFLLNQDAWIKPDTIKKLTDKMAEKPEYGILSPIHLSGTESELDFNFSYYIFADRCPGLVSDFVTKGEAEDRIYPIKFVNAALWLISKQCLHTIGGFAPVFPHYGEDENYICRLEYHGYKTGIYPKAFGIHDRSRSERKDPSFAKIKNKELVTYLIILTNIHEAFFKCIYRSFATIFVSSLSNILRLSFKNVIIEFLVSVNIICLLPQISKNRNISKNKGNSFLKI